MEKSQARSLIHQTFTQPFEKGGFLHFIKELLNRIDESKAAPWNKTYVKDAFKPGINRFERLATYADPSGEKIDVLVVYLEKESSLERARTFLRNFVADYLVTRGQKEAALVAFVSPSDADWRFSLVKMEYTTEEAETGKVKVSENLTPARRYSFLVGENEDSHTAQAQLLNILADSDHNPTLEDLERAFGVERVTKEFFEQYKSLFLDLKDELDELLTRDSRVRRDFEKKGVDTVDFAKKLLGQIVFLYFLQKKGWFGVARDAEWGTGPKNYLRLLFESRARIGAFSKSGSSGVNFFNDVLEPLFYEALAKGDREDDYYGHFHCKIPFLNGGLFDPLNGYDWVHTDIDLPDALFSNGEKTEKGDKGTGILDVFDRYNFTVNEAEPLEKEVAVDPEMLGKVFENLLEVKERKSKGSFYTPREIVHYMCRQSLVSYLEKELAEASVPRLDIETLMRVGEQAADFELARLDKSTGYRPQLPKSIETNALLLDRKLEEIAVCDPAVGSGAFLVGMMSEIVRARKTLTPYFSDKSRRTAYEFKRHAIQSSLYGVDIDPGAVEIAKLRLWLSLVVDEDDIKEIKPLPNLDYKIMQGDSLVEEFEGIRLFDKRLVEVPSRDLKAEKVALNARITELSHQFFDLHGRGNRDKQTRRVIEKEIAKLKKEMKALDTPVAAAALPAQREINDLFSEAQQKLPQLKELHDELFEASSGLRKREIRESLSALEWDIMQATVRDGLRELEQKLDLLKQELGNSRRKKEPAKILDTLERKLAEVKAQKEERQKAGKHLNELRDTSTKPFFLWRLHFLEVFQRKDGFDVVIGNPPYIRVQTLQDSAPRQVEYLKAHYVAASKGNFDIYVVFVERGLGLLQARGNLSYILPHKFFNAQYGQPLRKLLSEGKHVSHVVHFGEHQVFPGATNYVCLLFLTKAGIDECRWVLVEDATNWLQTFRAPERTLPSTRITEYDWNFAVGRAEGLFEKLQRAPIKLSDVVDIFVGLQTSADDVFILNFVSETRQTITLQSKSLSQTWIFEKDLVHPIVSGTDVVSYGSLPLRQFILFPYVVQNEEAHLINLTTLSDSFPRTAEYLRKNKQRLEGRESGKFKGTNWHRFGRSQNLGIQQRSKLCVPRLVAYLHAAPDLDGTHYLDNVDVAGVTYRKSSGESLVYLLGLLNSRLLRWFFPYVSAPFRGGFRSANKQFLSLLPFRPINFSDLDDIARHDKLVKLVQKMLAAKKEWAAAEDDYEKRRLDLFCADLDREIDCLIYKLYELTDDEIAIVEGSTKR
jgi:type I restriction-modification system DNA methylase subunit